MEKNEKVRLSIIIPVYNADRYLKQCIESVLEHIDEKTEVIIVNDGSTDSSLEICECFEKKYDCIRVINKINEGVSRARNIAIEQARGEWINFIDADDMFQRNAIKSIEGLESDADVILCDYSKEYIYSQQRSTGLIEIPNELLKKGILNFPTYVNQIREYSYSIDGINNWTCWGKFFRKKIICENNIKFPEKITHGEDLVFCYQVYSFAMKIYYCPICLYFYRINNQSVSQKFNKNRITNTLGLFENLLNFEQEIKESNDFIHFVVDRIIACCKLYFAHEKNEMNDSEKIKELKEILQIEYICVAVKKCPVNKLSIGKKTNIVNGIILLLLKKGMYKQAIKVSKI